jgi:hypothetical protein
MSVMSGVMSIFSKTLPALGLIEFDAKLEGVTSKAIQLTQFPVEFGANANDHAILLPDRYLLTGAVSNTPLGIGLDDIGMMGAGAVASAVGGVAGAAISAVSAYLLAGSDETRSATTWRALSALLKSRAPIELVTEYETMPEMVIIRLDQRTRPEDEDGLIFIAELQEIRRISSQVGQGVTSADQLAQNDPIATQGAPMVTTGSASVEVIA